MKPGIQGVQTCFDHGIFCDNMLYKTYFNASFWKFMPNNKIDMQAAKVVSKYQETHRNLRKPSHPSHAFCRKRQV
jgi:hypothetical protein